MRPGSKPRFFIQKMAQNELEKKMPSTTAKATNRAAKDWDDKVHFCAHSAFAETHGIVCTASKSLRFAIGSRTSVSIRREYISECTFSIIFWWS